MKAILFFLLLCPLLVQAQPDTLRPIHPQDLKPIDSDLVPAYWGRYGTTIRSQYMYDGLDVRRPTDLGPYIMAYGNPDAIGSYQQFLNRRASGGSLLVIGSVAYVSGLIEILAARNEPLPKSTHGQKVDDNRGVGWLVVAFTGAVLGGIGWGMRRPGQHLRRAVQLYNRDLKQRGVSWQIQPYASFNASGIGLVGRF